jgi:uncharacterized protein YjbI with pentapeptide repeats
MTPIPAHLAFFRWYAPHCAWVEKFYDQSRHTAPEGTAAVRADLTGAILTGANLTDADLARADLTGADLTGADLTGADLTDANLTDADLTRANLIGAKLIGAKLTDAILTGAKLTDADLARADLTGAIGLPAAPVVPDLDAQILARVDADTAALEMGAWHTCDTTHCRAGWAIHLAGEAGAALESKYGAPIAGALIYHASTGRIPNFYASNEAALADMRAKLEKA